MFESCENIDIGYPMIYNGKTFYEFEIINENTYYINVSDKTEVMK